VCYLAALAGAFIVSAAPHVQYYDGAAGVQRCSSSAAQKQRRSELRARFYGLLVLLVLWLEVAACSPASGYRSRSFPW
jgi:hypothetical protein